jgi:hypothetical protein
MLDMYYDAQRKLAFVMPPRTGTTMFSQLLKSWGVPEIGNSRHSKPSEVTITELHTLYGFFRDPLDRYISLVRYYKMIIAEPSMRKSNEENFAKFGMTVADVQALTYAQFIDFAAQGVTVTFYMHPQTDWLANAQLLNFNNYTQEILRVAKMLGQTQVRVGKLNESTPSDEVPSQRVIDYVQARYSDDYRLGRERGLLA